MAKERKLHVLVVPYPAQGHINPVLAFSKSLVSKGAHVTVTTTTKLSSSVHLSNPSSSITIETISDGSEEVKEQESIEGYFNRFKAVFSENLANFIDDQIKTTTSPRIVVYDSSMPWILDIAHDRGLLGASFFTQSCAVCALYYYLKQGTLKYPYEDGIVSLPSLPALELWDFPSFSEFDDPNHTIMNLLADQFINIEKVDWIFFNTFDKLENEVVKWMTSKWPIKTVGPTFALSSTGSPKPSEDKNHMISLFEPDDHEACSEWLNSKEPASVVYVSFGSIASLKKEQMNEIARGLMMIDCYFLWVVRASEDEKLPPNYSSLASERGNLVVKWCNQPQVLAHPSIACFMSHCGWNSTLEALTFGVPIIAIGRWVDQQTNAKFIEDVWRVGVRVIASVDGIITREEIAKCVKRVMEREGLGNELRRNAYKWKELANEAVQVGGTSGNNIEDFMSKLQCS